ncbi:MAG: anti-phage dCTP deaminase [Gaiellaceae bacterium]
MRYYGQRTLVRNYGVAILTMNPSRRIRSAGPEIVIALVGAAGTDLDGLTTQITQKLKEFDYQSEPIRLADLVRNVGDPDLLDRNDLPFAKYIEQYQMAGDRFREELRRGDALALAAILEIRKHRTNETGDVTKPCERKAFIVRSLKNPRELATLRRVYGHRLTVISAYLPRSTRSDAIKRKTRRYSGDLDQLVRTVIEDDERRGDLEYGQNVRNTYPEADFFLDTRKSAHVGDALERFLDIIFGYPYSAPTIEEVAMFHAQAAALRSTELGRQVGAVVVTETGAVTAIGTNEVPKFGGGLYTTTVPASGSDGRDFKFLEEDQSLRKRTEGFDEILAALHKAKLVNESVEVETFMAALGRTQFKAIIEYGRAVHAEMAALTDAAMRGVAVAGSTLFVTTFPCHLCMRHIIAAGINRVVYVHPYPKSLAGDLHRDAITIDPEDIDAIAQENKKLAVMPFVGVAPRVYIPYFTAPSRRKNPDGTILSFPRESAVPKLIQQDEQATYLVAEGSATQVLRKGASGEVHTRLKAYYPELSNGE